MLDYQKMSDRELLIRIDERQQNILTRFDQVTKKYDKKIEGCEGAR